MSSAFSADRIWFVGWRVSDGIWERSRSQAGWGGARWGGHCLMFEHHLCKQCALTFMESRLQKAFENKKLVLVEAKNAERSAMQSFYEKKVILEVYTKAGRKMSKHLAQMQAVQERLSSSKSTVKDVKALRLKLDDERVLDKSLDAKLVERQGKAEQLDASRKLLLREKDLKCGDSSKELHRLKMDIESRKHDLLTRQKKVEAVVAEVDAINSKTNAVKASGASKQRELMIKAEEIVKMFNQSSSSLSSLLSK